MDHVHVLTRFHTTIAVADLVQHLKGSSSHLVTHELQVGKFFKWQGSYGAFTVAKSDVPRVKAYILDQKRHHAQQMLWHEFEVCEIPEDDTDQGPG
jgi:REP element-mobilizing transposase RayT